MRSVIDRCAIDRAFAEALETAPLEVAAESAGHHVTEEAVFRLLGQLDVSATLAEDLSARLTRLGYGKWG